MPTKPVNVVVKSAHGRYDRLVYGCGGRDARTASLGGFGGRTMLRRRLARVLCGSLLAALAAGFWLTQAAHAESETDAARRQEAIRAETDHLVRRVGTMLRVLEYYRLD